MATKTRPHEIDVDDLPDGEDVAAAAETLIDRGRAALERVPDVAVGARDVLVGAQGQLEDLSDLGAIAAAGFALGISGGLLLAGAPRAVLIVSLIPVALTLRSAMMRGVRPAKLVN
jgi:hypothetical protein